MGRSPCCDENGLKKGPWTPEEDHKLVHFIQKHGHGSWRALPKLAGLNRCGKSCRLRWTNYLRPDIKRGKFSPEEEETILKLHSILGNKWSAIATHLPGRTDNEIKNFWNTHLKKKLIQMGIDPTTHRPRTDFFAALPQLIALASLHELRKANRMTDSNTNIDIIDNINETEEIALLRYPQQPEGRLWDDHVARLQAEAIQGARLQCFQYLLQSASAMANNSGAVNGLGSGISAAVDSDAMSLLRSEMEVSSSFPPILPSSIPVQNASSHDQVNQLTTFFFEPPESYNDQNRECSAMAGFNQGENSSPRTPFNIMSAPQYSQLQLPPLADISVANQQGDACSISSCKENETASIIWPDQLLLDDQFITEFV